MRGWAALWYSIHRRWIQWKIVQVEWALRRKIRARDRICLRVLGQHHPKTAYNLWLLEQHRARRRRKTA